MDLKKLDDRIVKNEFYQFLHKHKQVIKIIEGFFIIGLLLGIWIYFYQDYKIKSEIRDTCGYKTDKFECVCTPYAVEEFREGINISNVTIDIDNIGKQHT